MRRLLTMSLATALAGLIFNVPVSPGSQPVITRIDATRSGIEGRLSAACGFTIMYSETGDVTLRTFDDGGPGVFVVNTVNIFYTLSANGREYTSHLLHDTGAVIVREAPDGTLTLSLPGQSALFYTGVLKIDLLTGQVTLDPRHRTDAVDPICAALAV